MCSHIFVCICLVRPPFIRPAGDVRVWPDFTTVTILGSDEIGPVVLADMKVSNKILDILIYNLIFYEFFTKEDVQIGRN